MGQTEFNLHRPTEGAIEETNGRSERLLLLDTSGVVMNGRPGCAAEGSGEVVVGRDKEEEEEEEEEEKFEDEHPPEDEQDEKDEQDENEEE